MSLESFTYPVCAVEAGKNKYWCSVIMQDLVREVLIGDHYWVQKGDHGSSCLYDGFGITVQLYFQKLVV